MLIDRSDPDTRHRALKISLIAALAVGALGSVATVPNIGGWYDILAKPSFSPPDWLFAPVWTALYALMAVAAWRVWRIENRWRPALTLYAIQLALNCAWCFIFFGAHATGAGLGEIAALFVAVAATTIAFWRVDRLAGLLFVPYLAWMGFAALLNLALWQLNG